MTDSPPSPTTSTAGLSGRQLAKLLDVGRTSTDADAPAEDAQPLHLSSTSGPVVIAYDAVPPGPITLGRGNGCDVKLTGDDHVSRRHASLVYLPGGDDGPWYLVDNHSRHGTWLNGVQLSPDRRYPLASRDVIEIQPWSLTVDLPGREQADHMTLVPTHVESRAETDIQPVVTMPEHELQLQRLQLLLDCSGRFHQAGTIKTLAEEVLEMIATGTGFANMAILGPMDDAGNIEVISQRGAMRMPDGSPRLSRSLIQSAAAGQPVRLSTRGEQQVTSQSIAELGIAHAVCVPLLIGRSVVGYLYLDRRRTDETPGQITDDEAQFAVGIGRLTALAWANLRRQEMQLRQERMDAALSAAAVAQRWVLPTDAVRHGRFLAVGDNRAGEMLSGDFFDIIPVGDHHLAVVLGDVCGKGVAASIWTTAAQGFMRGLLSANRDLPQVVTELNQYMHDRSEHALFMSLWLGLFDSERGELRYVDAGHGYAFLLSGKPPNVQLNRLADAGGPLVGLEPTAIYEQATVALAPDQRVLIVSDGIIEQADPSVTGRLAHFGTEGVLKAAANVKKSGNELSAVFKAVSEHAQGQRLSDDTTALLVQWAD